ncbi:isoleucine--tRNA ligase [Granulicoccus sp. GXG6511]|uniref:isoleucine--tRNA ligase n=1 Tax=Granulicoccus sp. GXG6511 TaxID=3381351 RepID=UPI003D7E931D
MTTDPTPSTRAYRAVPPQVNLSEMEHGILELWADQDTFARSVDQTSDGEPWTFYEGPPTANGMPGTHHIEARVFKDVFPRFRTMQGRYVGRKAGWDCHGLPVELAVEKELGINGKPEIEAYGVEAFNAQCRESVKRHVGAFAELTTRMGYWVNMDDAYWTMDASYIESEWWALQQIFNAGWLTEDQRVAPYCPRCGTTLSDHELAQGYEDVTDTTAYVRFPLTSGRYAGKADLVIWTTTPWTLLSNALVAVGADMTYVTATDGTTTVIVAEDNVESALGDGWEIQDRFSGSDMVGWEYQRPFDVVDQPGRAWFVVTEDYVTAGDGTGLVHQAMAFGEDDYQSCKRHGVEFVNPIGPDGRFHEGIGLIGGEFFKDADAIALADLTDRGLLFRAVKHEHSYPHCWRCHTPLMYYAQPSWYIRTTQFKDALLRENEATNWYPDNIKWGRYGDWLKNNVDWALSRTRYWGTPLPIWRNDEDPSLMVCVGSLAELSELVGADVTDMDPHRPFIDDVTFTKPGVPGTFRRVPEVIDAWFDSGAMPFAQWGYPWAEGSKEKFETHFPADFICEATDQTRGWFYSQMAVNTAVFDQNNYRNVLCLGHILAEDGRKMSKHLGNILEPIPLMEQHGADAVRWFMACSGSPWMARRVGHASIQETVRKVLLTFWNSVSFQALYAGANGWTPNGEAPPVADRPVLDRWLVSKTHLLVREVTAALEVFDTQRTGALISEFVDSLSNWYVRRSRRRFWDGDPAALWTLHESLHIVTRLMAPLVPFITERVWQDLFVATDPEGPQSVHLAAWPVPEEALIDEDLDEAVALTERLVELGRSARAEAKVKVRQPLSRVLLPSRAYAILSDELRGEIAAELNVQGVESFASAGDLVDYSAKGNFRNLGKRFGKQTPVVANAIAAADAAAIAEALRAEGKAVVEVPVVDPNGVEVTADDVLISERPREGWSVINDQGETVALDLEITPELRRAGLAREVIRLVQETRKNSGFEVSDRIDLTWSAEGDLADAVREHAALIADEVLAVEMAEGDIGPDWVRDEDLGLAIQVVRH